LDEITKTLRSLPFLLFSLLWDAQHRRQTDSAYLFVAGTALVTTPNSVIVFAWVGFVEKPVLKHGSAG